MPQILHIQSLSDIGTEEWYHHSLNLSQLHYKNHYRRGKPISVLSHACGRKFWQLLHETISSFRYLLIFIIVRWNLDMMLDDIF